MRNNRYPRAADDARHLAPGEVLLCHVTGSDAVDGVIWGRVGSRLDCAPRALPPPHAWVQVLVVDEQARRRGIGRALLAAFADHSKSHGATFLGLEAFPPSRGSELVMFYRACGLEPLGLDDRLRLWAPL